MIVDFILYELPPICTLSSLLSSSHLYQYLKYTSILIKECRLLFGSTFTLLGNTLHCHQWSSKMYCWHLLGNLSLEGGKCLSSLFGDARMHEIGMLCNRPVQLLLLDIQTICLSLQDSICFQGQSLNSLSIARRAFSTGRGHWRA